MMQPENSGPDIAKRLGAANQIKARFDEVVLTANVRDSGEARVAATLLLTILEQFAATLCLIQNGFSSHAPILVRSMLEGLADLLNVVADPQYVDQIRYENARSDVILFEQYANDKAMQEDKEAIATLSRWKEKAIPIRDSLAQKGRKTQSVVDKFKKADIFANYVAYRVFCSFAHNQLTTLLARHAGKFELRYHHEAPAELIASTLTVAVSILTRAFNTLHRFSDVPSQVVEKSANEADKIWAAA